MAEKPKRENLQTKMLHRAQAAEARVEELEAQLAAAAAGGVAADDPEECNALRERVAQLEEALTDSLSDTSTPDEVVIRERDMLETRVQELQAEVAALKSMAAASVSAVLPGAVGKRHLGRIENPNLVPAQYRKPDGGVDIQAVNEALNQDYELVIPGITRRG